MPVASEVLQAVPLFRSLSTRELTYLAEGAMVRRFAAGDVIASADEPCQELYALQSGAVRILRISTDGHEQVLHITRAGDIFAGAPVFCGCPLPATCQAQEDVTVITIPGSDFMSMAEAHPQIVTHILGLCCARMRRLTNLAAELSSKTVVRRLAWLLLGACPCVHTGTQSGSYHLTEQDLATRLGSTQETISRAVGQLHERGIVQTRREEVVVYDVEGLRRVATGLEPHL